MSVPQAIINIDREPSNGWRVWHHDQQGLHEIGLVGIPEDINGFEGYYTKLAAEVREPKKWTLEELLNLMDGIKPDREMSQREALQKRNSYDSTWQHRPLLRAVMTERHQRGELYRDDAGNLTGAFEPKELPADKDVTDTAYRVRITPLGRVTLRVINIRTGELRQDVRYERANDYILDRFLPVPVRRVHYTDGSSVVHVPIDTNMGTNIENVLTGMKTKRAVRKTVSPA